MDVSCVAHAGERLPKMAKRCFRVTTSPGSATLLSRNDTSEEDTEHLATAASYCVLLRGSQSE